MICTEKADGEIRLKEWFILLLGFLFLSSICHQVLQVRQNRAFTRQIKSRRKEKSQKEICVELPTASNAQLAAQINELFRQMQETEIRYQQKEEEQKRMITDISHDIRTPLTSVSGYFQMLMETEDAGERERYSSIIKSRLGSLQELLEEFFAYAKLQGQDTAEEAGQCDIRQLFSESMFLFYDEIEGMQEHEITLPEERLMVYAREEELRRIFQNILKNAVLHGGTKIRISMQKAEKYAEICVENETREELPEELSCVFERFYRADEARSVQSSGLGLCIVKELTEKLGGMAQAYQPEGQWFGIRLLLPLSICQSNVKP